MGKDRIIVTFTTASSSTLSLYKQFLIKFIKKKKIAFLLINSPRKYKKAIFLKSPHVNKKAKENFQLSIFQFKLLISANFFFFKELRINVPKNIHLKLAIY